MMTLLDKAKLYRRKPGKSDPSQEEIDLALAWMRDEISFSSVAIALGKKSGSSVYANISLALRAGFRRGQISIQQNGGGQ